MGAYFLGPRHMRFAEKAEDNNTSSKDMEEARQFDLGHNVPLQAIGTLILWFGWYGFNCGSTLAAAGAMELASKVALNTSLAAASGGIMVVCLQRYISGVWCVPAICNGVLAGLVSITVSRLHNTQQNRLFSHESSPLLSFRLLVLSSSHR